MVFRQIEPDDGCDDDNQAGTEDLAKNDTGRRLEIEKTT